MDCTAADSLANANVRAQPDVRLSVMGQWQTTSAGVVLWKARDPVQPV